MKRTCENCTQKETCHLLSVLLSNGNLTDYFTWRGSAFILKSDLALACKFYEEEKE